jgi:hypothetical protein
VHGGRLLDPTATLEAAGLGDGMCVFAMVRAQLDPSRCACSPKQGPAPRAYWVAVPRGLHPPRPNKPDVASRR